MALPWAGDLFQKLQEMQQNSRAFNELFGLRTEVCKGTLGILQETWDLAKNTCIQLGIDLGLPIDCQVFRMVKPSFLHKKINY